MKDNNLIEHHPGKRRVRLSYHRAGHEHYNSVREANKDGVVTEAVPESSSKRALQSLDGAQNCSAGQFLPVLTSDLLLPVVVVVTKTLSRMISVYMEPC